MPLGKSSRGGPAPAHSVALLMASTLLSTFLPGFTPSLSFHAPPCSWLPSLTTQGYISTNMGPQIHTFQIWPSEQVFISFIKGEVGHLFI